VQFLMELWLPILLSTVFVFIASCVIHMVVPIHKADYKGVSDEPRLLDAVRAQNLAPGEYYFPWCATMKEMGKPEFVQKRMQGPVGLLTLMQPGPPGMGKNLVQWVLFTLVIAIFTAYVGMLALVPGAEFMPVLRVTATVAWMAFGPAYVHSSIWKGLSWSIAFKFLFDGLVYALVMGATFAWLWPSA
jgi:hypothetical protein